MSDGASVLEELKVLLREALRVGSDREIDDDMPLIGGPIDLDSIDILLVISSVEKRFGLKIPNEAVGRSVFATVRTLANYIEANRETLAVKAVGGGGPDAAGGKGSGGTTALPTPVEFLERLPHGPEFRFVSMLKDIVPGEGAMGVWMVTGNEPFLAGHFPGRPVVPGVLISEGLAQVAGLAGGNDGEAAMLAAVDMKFLAPVIPPAAIELRATKLGGEGDGAVRKFDVVASVGGMAVAKGQITLHFRPK